MKFIYFNNGSGLGTAKSGGAIRHIETARGLIERGEDVYIVTTSGARVLYENEDLKPKKFFLVRASLFKSEETSNLDRVFSYVISTIHSLLRIPLLPKVDIVYAPSDYFCDVIPSLFYKFVRRAKFVVMIHHICKSPFKRKGSFLLNFVSFVGQRFDYLLIALFADKVLVYDTPEGEQVAHILFGKDIPRNKVSYVFNGLNFSEIAKAPQGDKIYDACFAGGLRHTKGIYDIVPVWSRVCKYKEDAKLLVAGAGTPRIVRGLREKIAEAGLQDNIVLAGALDSATLYKTLKQSKVFISLSHEEGWGISVREALAAGLPVVAFDLPAFSRLGNNIITIGKFDHVVFADSVVELLENKEFRTMETKKGIDFVKKYGWKEIAETEFEILETLLGSGNL